MTKLLSLILFISCSTFINQLDENLLNQKKESYYGNEKILSCKRKNAQTQFINSNEKSQLIFNEALGNDLKNYNFKFVEKVVIWSLFQMNLRPDIHSPTSKYQIFFHYKNKDHYFHFYSKDQEAYSSFYALEYLLKTFPSKYSLLTLSRIVDDKFKNSYTVSKDFEEFLKNSKTRLENKSPFQSKFFRGDETLKENENILAQKLLPLVKKYLKTKSRINYQVSKKLFEFKSPQVTSYCNYDMNMYENSIYLIHKDFIKSHLYGFKQAGNHFLTSTSQDYGDIESLNGTHFLKGRSLSRSAAFCKFEFKEGQNIWLVSTKSRDPGQHLYHLIEYGIDGVKNLSELEQIMRFSRHLFLENPHRLIIESKRSSQAQLDRILKIDIPIYNSSSLGKVWGHFESSKENSFIIDDREDGNILCK